jgi:hypothetical protein
LFVVVFVVCQLGNLVDPELSAQFTEHVMHQLLAASDDLLKKENLVRVCAVF